jgi:hypothetical protein
MMESGESIFPRFPRLECKCMCLIQSQIKEKEKEREGKYSNEAVEP